MNFINLTAILAPLVIAILAVTILNQQRKITGLRSTLKQVRLLKRIQQPTR